MSGSIGCWGTLWNEECLVASLAATLRSGVRSGAERIPVDVFMASTPFLHSLQHGMLILKCTRLLL